MSLKSLIATSPITVPPSFCLSFHPLHASEADIWRHRAYIFASQADGLANLAPGAINYLESLIVEDEGPQYLPLVRRKAQYSTDLNTVVAMMSLNQI